MFSVLIKTTILFCLFIHALCAHAAEEIVGSWQLNHLVYEGNEMELPNPELRLSFTFYKNGTIRLYWDRTDATGFCESFSTWRLSEPSSDKQKLTLNTFALSPDNASDCSKDPDMQLGEKAATDVWIKNQQLFMVIMLADQDLIYVFNKQEIL